MLDLETLVARNEAAAAAALARKKATAEAAALTPVPATPGASSEPHGSRANEPTK